MNNENLVTTIFTGSGSEENSWIPIERVLDKNYDYYPKDDPNYIFADLVNRLRWLYFEVTNPLNENNAQQAVRLYFRLKELYDSIKRQICDEVRLSSERREITLRPYIDVIEKEFVNEKTNFITTNWDLLLDKRFKTVFHLHGTIEDPETLYLPSESIEEYYRSSNDYLTRMYGVVLKIVIPPTQRLIIYGLGFNALDSEVGLILEEGFHGTNNLKEVIIIDPNSEKIKNKVQFALKGKNPAYILRNPG